MVKKSRVNDAFVAAIKKQRKSSSVRLLENSGDIGRVTHWLHTGSFALDLALGQGWPFGRIVEIFGNESSGKTALCYHALAECQRQGGIAVLFEREGAYSIEFAAVLGLDSEKLLFYQPRTVEEVFDEIDTLLEVHDNLENKRLMVICWDSIAGTPIKAVADGGAGTEVWGQKAKVLSTGLSRLGLPLEQKNILFVCVNQIRDNIGGFGADWKTPGGHGLPFHASVRLKLTKQKDIMVEGVVGDASDAESGNPMKAALKRREKKDGIAIGNSIGAFVYKSKVASPHRKVVLDFYYTSGLDPYSGLLDLLYRHGRIKRSGGYYSYRGKNFRSAAFQDVLVQYPGLLIPLGVVTKNEVDDVKSEE